LAFHCVPASANSDQEVNMRSLAAIAVALVCTGLVAADVQASGGIAMAVATDGSISAASR
jgi:hypothetical protein